MELFMVIYEYQDRIPINTSDGIGLGLIPSIYYSFVNYILMGQGLIVML